MAVVPAKPFDQETLTNAAEAMALVASFYPRQRIEAKTQFGLEEIFERMDRGDVG